jgi:hypothetical protein
MISKSTPWIKNSSLVKAYHACERFLLGTIASHFFKNTSDPLKDESSLRKNKQRYYQLSQ